MASGKKTQRKHKKASPPHGGARGAGGALEDADGALEDADGALEDADGGVRSRRPTEAPIIAATSAGGTAPSSRRKRALWYSALRPTLARCWASRAPASRSFSSPSSVSICWSFLR